MTRGLDLADRCGATVLRRRALDELAAIGARPLLLSVFIVTGGTAALADEGPPLCQTGCATAIVPPGAAPMPFGIASGPLGSEWFADGSADNTVDRIDQQGAITTYPVPTPNSGPGWVTVDNSGNVWFAERLTGKIGRITPDGTITEFPLPSPTALPQGSVVGPDGNLYITEQAANAIARLNPGTGQVTEFPVPTPAANPLGLALGPTAPCGSSSGVRRRPRRRPRRRSGG